MNTIKLPQRPSGKSMLTRRLIVWIIVGEIAFGMIVGLTIGFYSAQLAAQERRASLDRVGRVVAASLMPMIADQDAMRLESQMKSVLDVAGIGDISSVEVFDSAGMLIASAGDPAIVEERTGPFRAFAVFTEPQVVMAPMMVDGLHIGSARVVFMPQGIQPFLAAHFVAALIVILSVALVSAPWIAWLTLRFLVEPIEELREGAIKLSEGRRDVVLDSGRPDEIGDLARALDQLTEELAEKEQTLEDSFSKLQSLYIAEAQAKEQVERLSRTKSNFVAVSSHEILSPLSVIRLYTEMLSNGELGTMNAATRDALTSVSAATRRLESIVSDLRDTALLERGLLPLVFAYADLRDTVEQAVEDANALGSREGVSVLLERQLPQIPVSMDAKRIRQVLDNLLSNAIKYSDGANEVLVKVECDNGVATVVVIDGGRGVPEDRVDELFTLFGRLESQDNRDTPGLGLGLAISLRIAEAHGGSITYMNNPEGQGAVFTLRLPVDSLKRSGQEPLAHIAEETVAQND